MATFIFTEGPITAWRKVPVNVPTDEGFTTQTMRMQMVACSKAELLELRDAEAQVVFAATSGDRDADKPKKDVITEFLVPRIPNWDDVSQVADDGKSTVALPFSESGLRAMLAIPYVQSAVVRAYTNFVAGGKEEPDARTKNY